MVTWMLLTSLTLLGCLVSGYDTALKVLRGVLTKKRYFNKCLYGDHSIQPFWHDLSQCCLHEDCCIRRMVRDQEYINNFLERLGSD